MGIAALVLGIIAIVLCWTPFLGAVLGLVGVILGFLGMKKAEKKGLSIAGLVVSVIGFLLGAWFSYGWFLAGQMVSEGAAEFENAMNQAMKDAGKEGGMDLNKMIEDAKKQAEEEAAKAE